jgi:hypothetical protein
MWQQIASAVLVLVAAAYATWSLWLRRRWRARRAAMVRPVAGGGAYGCDRCGANDHTPQKRVQ